MVDVCRHLNATARSTVVDVGDANIEHLSAPVSGDISCNGSSRRRTESSEVHVTHNSLRVQFGWVSKECDTRPSLLREQDDDNISIWALLETWKDKMELR